MEMRRTYSALIESSHFILYQEVLHKILILMK